MTLGLLLGSLRSAPTFAPVVIRVQPDPVSNEFSGTRTPRNATFPHPGPLRTERFTDPTDEAA